MSEKGTESADVLHQILGDTEKVIATIGARTESKLDLEQQIEDMQKQFEEAAQLRDERQRQMRERVLTADLERLRAEAQTEQQDLAQAVFGLNAFLEKLGMEYAKIGELSEEEQALVRVAEEELALARTTRQEADGKWFFKQSAIEDAESAIALATAKLEEAQREARRMARQRLLSADMEQSLQEFQLRVHKTIDIMSQRMQEVEKQLKIVAARKAKAFEVKEQAARALEKLDRDLNDKEAELRREEEILPTLENGTPRYAEQTTKVSNLRAQVEELRGRRNTAFVLFQSKEKFAAELEVH
jgi:DNA repair exonuclease SbcCD ATPase subunit